MMREIGLTERQEQVEQLKESENYKDIKPQESITTEDCDRYWDDVFKGPEEKDNPEEELEKLIKEYLNDIYDKSEHRETLPENPFNSGDLRRRTPEENQRMREEFDDKKADLRNQWEQKHGVPWPRHEEDVRLPNGVVIRRKGDRYDAHHIQPLSLGGKNEVDNITPLNANVHFDSRGVHSPDSPYSRMNARLGGDLND